MQLRDISLKKRLLITNALMVIIPITLLFIVGAMLLGGLRHAGSLQQEALTLLWPEKGTSLSVQFALSSLRAEAEKKRLKLHNIESDIRLLEGAGIRLSAVQGGDRSTCRPQQIRQRYAARSQKNAARRGLRSYGMTAASSFAGKACTAVRASWVRAQFP